MEQTIFEGNGAIVVKATMANRAVPVANVRVLIWPDGGALHSAQVLITDENGTTQRFLVRAPSTSYSFEPFPPRTPYATMNIRVEKPGFRTKNFINVPVFDGQTSIQYVQMLPVPSDQTQTVVDARPQQQ